MARVAFKQCDVERAFRAAKAVGHSHPTVEITPDGAIRVLTAPQSGAVAPDDGDNLDAELEAWRAGNGDG